MSKILKGEPILALATVIAVGLGVAGIETNADAVLNAALFVVPLLGGVIGRSHVIPLEGALEEAKADETK